MKRNLVTFAVAAILVMSFLAANVAEAGRVRGYVRRDGTYVQPHSRSNPDRSPYNNYGYPGNYNPNKGKISPGNQSTYVDRYYQRKSGHYLHYGFTRSKKKY